MKHNINSKCSQCSGTGMRPVSAADGEGFNTVEVVCTVCNGTGILSSQSLDPQLIEMFDDMNDKINDISDKINDIFEKLNEV